MNLRRTKTRLAAGAVLAAGLAGVAAGPADAAVTASFRAGTLSVVGDTFDNIVVLSRNAAGTLLVNGGAVTVVGGTPTVATTTRVEAFGLGGNDTIALSEVNGALPAANLFGGSGNDALTGGSGTDQLFGQAGNDALLGRAAGDFLFGGTENDTLTGGDADDQVFGQGGNDRMVWNPGDDTDLDEGGTETDTVEVNGGGSAEQFTATANGTRVRFDRVNPAPFALDIGSSENLVLNANGGNDTFSGTGNLAALIKITADGGAGDDTLLGSNGADILIGGANTDFVDGQQGDDVGLLGDGDDVFQWDPGDGSDIVEGQAGRDELAFNGSNANERMQAQANGIRVLFTRDIANIVMDLNDVEVVDAKSFGGADQLTVGDLSGTDVTAVETDLALTGGGADDAAADNVIVTATNGEDVAAVSAGGRNAVVVGLAARVAIAGSGANDRLTVNAQAGDDVIDAGSVPAGAILLTLDGGADDDVLIGGAGPDTLLGGAGDDVILGGPGVDAIDGGTGDDVVIDSATANRVAQAEVAGAKWLRKHTRVVRGDTVLRANGERHVLPSSDRAELLAAL